MTELTISPKLTDTRETWHLDLNLKHTGQLIIAIITSIYTNDKSKIMGLFSWLAPDIIKVNL